MLSIELKWAGGLAVICLIVFLRKNRRPFLLIIPPLIFTSFYFVGLNAKNGNRTIYQESEQTLTIHLSSPPVIDGNRLTAIITANGGEKLLLRYTIPSLKEKQELLRHFLPSHNYVMVGQLVLPSENRNFNTFNYRDYLNARHIHWIFQPEMIDLHHSSKRSISFSGILLTWRIRLLKHIDHDFKENTAYYLKALLLGDKNDFPEEVYDAFRTLGIVHLLAISGLHAGVIATGCFAIFMRLGMTKERAILLLSLFLPIYAFLAGGNPPVMRAVFMIFLIMASRFLPGKYAMVDTVSLSAVFFILNDPYIILNTGFQLSYAVCFSLAFSQKIFSRSNHLISKLLHISFVCQIVTFPFLMYQFYQVSLLGFIVNAVYVPYFSFLVLPVCFLDFFLSYLSPRLQPSIDQSLSWILTIVEHTALFLEKIPHAALVTGRPGRYALILMFVLMVLGFKFLESGGSYKKYLVSAVFVMAAAIGVKGLSPHGSVTFIDIGQGDSILIQLPFQQGTYLIDTGGEMEFPVEEWERRSKHFSIGKDILLPTLKSKGITRINKLILTHSDMDHIGTVFDMMGEIIIDEIIISPNSDTKPLMRDIVHKAIQIGIPVVEAETAKKWQVGDCSFMLIPPPDKVYEGNNDSLVLLADMGGLKWIFTGDLEERGEKELLARYRIDADVLKVGHHGSETSTSDDFLDGISPKIAVISVGKNNRYGHPDPSIIQKLEERHIKIYRTDQMGAIEYVFKKNKGTFATVFP
ncbi:DNA internalization-related competence protein ComEC/Rec2 [Falsibacillus albus]|nr:DNA internalization-related competence protein ComEC/Rec2 [Falsibacillus albus]